MRFIISVLHYFSDLPIPTCYDASRLKYKTKYYVIITQCNRTWLTRRDEGTDQKVRVVREFNSYPRKIIQYNKKFQEKVQGAPYF